MSMLYQQTTDGWEPIGELVTPLAISFVEHDAGGQPQMVGRIPTLRGLTLTIPRATVSREALALLFPDVLQVWADEAALAAWEGEGGR